MSVEYEFTKDSSYSGEITLTAVFFSRFQSFDYNQFQDPTIVEIAFEDYQPLENSFNVTSISKKNVCFLQKIYDISIPDDPNSRFTFPSESPGAESSIFHSPSEVWGYDHNQLVLTVVIKYRGDPTVHCTWYLGDNL